MGKSWARRVQANPQFKFTAKLYCNFTHACSRDRDINYKPRDRWVENEIGDRLGVGRIPLREALLSLERRAFLKARNRKGREVVGISKREISENYSIREFIEGYILSEKSLQPNKKLDATLKQMSEQMERAVRKKDLESYRSLHFKFHHEIAQSLNNKKLYEIC
jgi:DNA-binding GntR family transcriptional regulator